MEKNGISVEFQDGTLLFRGITPAVAAELPAGIIAADDRTGGIYRALACDYRELMTDLRQKGFAVEDNAKGFRQQNIR